MSAPEIDPNKLQSDAEEYATSILIDSADWARALLGNLDDAKAHPVVTIGHALLTLLDRRAEERYLQGQTLIEALQDIRESIDFVGARDGDNANEELTTPPKQAHLDYEWLKWLLSLAMPNLSDAEYREAIVRIQRLAGL